MKPKAEFEIFFMKNHLKRLTIPKTWAGIEKKSNKFILNANPGPHTKELSMPIATVLKKLGYAKTTREVKKILNNKQTLVDGRKVKSISAQVGFSDELTIPEIKENYKCELNENGELAFTKLNNENKKISKIIGKTTVKNGKLQLNLLGGRNALVENKDYKTGDSLLIEVPSQKIIKKIPFEKGAKVILFGGKHAGEKGTLEEIQNETIIYKNKENKDIRTLKKYAMAIEL